MRRRLLCTDSDDHPERRQFLTDRLRRSLADARDGRL